MNHCLLVETAAGLVLIDSGFGMRDVLTPTARLSRLYLAIMRPKLRTDLTAVRQVRRLGFHPRDVRHIILSHLDCDRAGGLDDFPEATIHVRRDEVEHAERATSQRDRRRFRPQQWSSRARWRTYATAGETFYGFPSVHPLEGLPPELLLVPLPGHTMGHAGVAIRTAGGWLLYAGDAYAHHGEMAWTFDCPTSARIWQWVMEKDRAARLQTRDQLRAVACAMNDVTVFCAQDRLELARMQPPRARSSSTIPPATCDASPAIRLVA